MSYNSPSIGDLLIATLCSARSTRKFYAIIREREFKRYRENSVRVSLSRLHKKGYLNNSSQNWSLTQKGKLYARDTRLFSYLPSPFNKNSAENTIISFDIPEPDRIIRNWLRNQIKIFGYKMLQQSLWIGPGPLPSTFLARLKELKIREKIKIFSKVKKSS